MVCPECGANISDNVNFCPDCGAKAGSSVGDTTKPMSTLGATRVYAGGETKATDLGATRVYTGKELGKTVIFTPQEERKPVFGWLVVTAGKEAWKVFKLTDEEGQFSLGRGEECALKLEDEKMEPRHASIRFKDGKLYLTDLDTSAGTLVNEKEIARIELQDGDEIKTGSTTLKFRKL